MLASWLSYRVYGAGRADELPALRWIEPLAEPSMAAGVVQYVGAAANAAA